MGAQQTQNTIITTKTSLKKKQTIEASSYFLDQINEKRKVKLQFQTWKNHKFLEVEKLYLLDF